MTTALVRDLLPEVYADLDTVVVNAVDVVDSVIRYVEIISAETEAGQRVARVLDRIGSERP